MDYNTFDFLICAVKALSVVYLASFVMVLLLVGMIFWMSKNLKGEHTVNYFYKEPIEDRYNLVNSETKKE